MSFLSSGGDDEDDFLFSSAKGGKKLADVFKSEGPAPSEKLTYDRPKPPGTDSQRRGSSGSNSAPQPTAASAQPAVIYFQGVQLFKYETGKQSPTPLGKVGAAVLQHQASNKWTLLLYHTPQKPITTTTLHTELKWSVTLQGTEHWGQLTDDAAQSWAIHFPTRDECEALSAQLALAQWCAARSEGLGVLDLMVPAKGHAIEAGDLVGVRYSAWTSAQNKIGSKYESNTDKERPLRFEVGKGSVLAGLDRGVLGMKRGQRRVLVMPAALGYGDKGLAPHVTAHMTLVFVVELEKMKKSGTSSVSETRVENTAASGEEQAPLPTLPSVDVLSSSPTTAALENSTEDKAKSKLMERISKLGVPTMTAKPVTPVSSSPPHNTVSSTETASVVQSEVAVNTNSVPAVNAVAAPQTYAPPTQPLLAPTQPMYATAPMQAPLTHMNAMPPQSNQMVLSSQYNTQPPMYMNNTMNPYGVPQPAAQSMLMPQPQAALSTTEMVQLLVDERQYKVELKSKIDTMSTKLEQLSDKIDAPQRGRDIGGFTPRNLLDLIQKIVIENERLTVDVEEKSRHVTLLRENINQLHERNQRVVDENSKFSQERVQLQQLDQVREERNRLQQELQLSVQERNKLQREILQLQSEKTKVEEDLASANETIEAAARKVQNMKRTQQSLEDQVRTLNDERERENIERESLKSTVNTLSGEHKKYELKIREEQTRVKSAQQELEAVKAELEEERDNHQRTAKLVEENKRKYITEIKKRESTFDEEKSSLEMQIEELRATLKKERTASGTLSKEQLERVEQECEHKWQAVLASREAESRQKLAQTVDEYETQLQSVREQRAHDQHKLVQLQDTVRQLQEQLAAAPSTVTAPTSSSDQQWQARLVQAVRAERQRSAEDMTTAVKSIMNNVYVNLTEQFDTQAEYDTASVLNTIKRVVVQTTLEVLQRQKEQQQLESNEPVQESQVDTEEEPAPANVREESVTEDKPHESVSADQQSSAVSESNVHQDESTAESTDQTTETHEESAHSIEPVSAVAVQSREEDATEHAVVEENKSEESTSEHGEQAPVLEQSTLDQSHQEADHSTVEQSTLDQSVVEQSPVLEQSTLDQSVVGQSPVFEQSTLDQSVVGQSPVFEQSTLDHSTAEQSTVDQSEQSALEQSTLEQSAIDHSIAEQKPLEQSTLDQSHQEADQSTVEQLPAEPSSAEHSSLEQSTLDHSVMDQSPLDHSALESQPSADDTSEQSALEQSTLPEESAVDQSSSTDAPKHDVIEVEGDLKASLDQAMLSSQYGTSTLEHSLPDERANPLEASMLPSSEETTLGERDNDLLASTLERPSSLEQSALEPSEDKETTESEDKEINVFETHDVKSETTEVTADDTSRQSAEANVETTESETKDTDENIQVQQGHSIEDYKEEEPGQELKLEDSLPVQVKTPVAQSPASRPSSAKKSLFDDDDDDDLFSKIPIKKPTPKKNPLFDDDDDLFK